MVLNHIQKKNIQELCFGDHAAIAGHVYNHLVETDTAKNIFDWAKTVYANNCVFAAENIQPFTLVEIHPIHFLVKDEIQYPCNDEVRHHSAIAPVKLNTNATFTNYSGETVSIAASSKVRCKNQCGHLIQTSDNGNVVRYHFGMYALFYISNRLIQVGERLSYQPHEFAPVVNCYVKGHRQAMDHFNEYYVKAVEHFSTIRDSSQYWDNAKKKEMQKLYDKINEARTSK